jgi:hypothetical protein
MWYKIANLTLDFPKRFLSIFSDFDGHYIGLSSFKDSCGSMGINVQYYGEGTKIKSIEYDRMGSDKK